MNSVHMVIRRFRVSLKKLSLFTAVGAMSVMGIATLATGSRDSTHGTGTVVLAETTTQTTPPAAPAVPSAAPSVKPTAFAGGDWPGMGKFGEDWA